MRIEAVKYLEDYKLAIRFFTGENKIVDLEAWLKKQVNPMVLPYLNKENFKKVKLDSGFLSWGDGEMEISGDSLID